MTRDKSGRGMVSVICIYNNEKVLNEVLLKSLDGQTVKPELLLIDNRNNKKYKSAAEALNNEAENAHGDILVFIHQDMWIHDRDWIENVEKYVNTISDLGIAGVHGMDAEGETWEERVKYSIKISNTDDFNSVPATIVPEKVQTLDECVLIVLRRVFDIQKFDAQTFDGWDCYGSDYCLAVAEIGLKAYVLPGLTSHCNLRANYPIHQFKGLLKYQKKLYRKYHAQYDIIHTWMGGLNPKYLRWSTWLARLKPLYHFIFPEFSQLLVRALSPSKSVLDLGCGYLSPLLHYKHEFSIGVDSNYQLLLEGKKLLIHDYYIQCNLQNIEFKPSSFDAVIALDVIENMSRDDGDILFNKMEQWVRHKIIIKTINHGARDGDGKIIHAPWKARDFKRKGYKVHGLGGLKYIKGVGSKRDYNFIRERLINATFWFCYFFPSFARELFAVKIIEDKR